MYKIKNITKLNPNIRGARSAFLLIEGQLIKVRSGKEVVIDDKTLEDNKGMISYYLDPEKWDESTKFAFVETPILELPEENEDQEPEDEGENEDQEPENEGENEDQEPEDEGENEDQEPEDEGENEDQDNSGPAVAQIKEEIKPPSKKSTHKELDAFISLHNLDIDLPKDSNKSEKYEKIIEALKVLNA